MNVAGSHEALGGGEKRVRDGLRLRRAPIADDGLKCAVCGQGHCPGQTVSGVDEFNAMRTFGYDGERPTEFVLKKIRQDLV